MAMNGDSGYAPVLAALATMQANVDKAQKEQAHQYLEKFQKSVGCPAVTTSSSYQY